ncbi:MAG TPA: methylenetetrahydrofolate reductase [Desulfomonilaceae bacterium]|nr:methylenetetrahydrofolate reductase [Desulfomonilaceae bacterium]
MASLFEQGLQSGKFQIVAQITPPKSADLSLAVALASSWKDKVDSFLVADNPSAVMGVSSLVLAQALKGEGHDVIMTISCRDRNRIALGSTALGSAALSIGSILCVSGDYFNFGDHPEAKPVYDLDSVQLLSMLRDMKNARDLGGNALAAPLDFFLGAAVCPNADPLPPQLMKARKKATAGASFLITSPIFTTEELDPFVSGAKDLPVKVLAGVLLPSYQEIAQYRDGSIPSTFIPENLVTRWRDGGEEQFMSSSADLVRKLISELKESGKVAGVCVSASGRESEIEGLL